jgi:hypothetical protein
MTRAAALALLLGACGGDGEGQGGKAGDYSGRADLEAEFVDPEYPEGQPWVLRTDEDGWELRQGARWADAAVLARFEVDRSDGLWLDDTRMLPASADEGARADGCTVTARGEVEVWYGTFPDAVETEVAEGRLAGAHAFARDIGPIRLTLDGETRELAFYW